MDELNNPPHTPGEKTDYWQHRWGHHGHYHLVKGLMCLLLVVVVFCAGLAIGWMCGMHNGYDGYGHGHEGRDTRMMRSYSPMMYDIAPAPLPPATPSAPAPAPAQ